MRKFCGWLLALVMLCMPVLGLADGIDKLPDTYAELCEMLPDMPTGDPENVAVCFPTMSDEGAMRIYCDKAEWPAATGSVGGFGLKFEYDEKIGAYVMDRQSYQMYQMSAASGDMTGYVAIGGQGENDWVKNIAIYFGNDAMIKVFWEDSPDTWDWRHVKDDTDTNYMMIGLRARKKFDNGTLDVWQYADRTEAIRYDKDGNVVEEKTYPEYSEFCKAFKPLAPTEQAK